MKKNVVLVALASLSMLYSCQQLEEEEKISPNVISEEHHICTEMPILSESGKPEISTEGASDGRVQWRPGQTIRIKFLNGDSFVQGKVKKYAKAWLDYANLKFEFVSARADADIKITFDEGSSWSLLGRNSRFIPQDQPSMNFGWFNRRTSDKEFSRTAIHEFGHALGLIHEHQSPVADIPWDKPEVYAYYNGAPNFWTKKQVEFNLFEKYAKNQSNYSQYDPKSIMHYSVPSRFTTTDFSVGLNTVLSEVDKAFISAIYPF